MYRIDVLGRRRHPLQNRGLRPLFPKLPPEVQTRAVRIAMRRLSWDRMAGLLASIPAPTAPRALGQLLERFLAAGSGAPPSRAVDWQAWQIQKEQRLLQAS